MVVFSDSRSDHLKHVRALFERLKAANPTVNLGKSEIANAAVKYLGKVVGQGKVLPVLRLQSTPLFPSPTGNLHICCNGWLLQSLLSQSAFKKPKVLLASAPILMAPNFSRLFVLYTDANDVGIEAVLVQADDSGVEHPVAFFSKKLRPDQVCYSTIEKETLALVLTLEHFEIYVSTSRPLVVYTDHNPLLFLQQFAFTNCRLL